MQDLTGDRIDLDDLFDRLFNDFLDLDCLFDNLFDLNGLLNHDGLLNLDGLGCGRCATGQEQQGNRGAQHRYQYPLSLT